MKRIKNIWLCSALIMLTACIPYGRSNVVQSRSAHDTRAEHVLRDSIYLHDSVFVARRADTVFYEKSRILYRDRLRVDTFVVCDTVCREKSVVVEKVVTKYPSPWLLLLVVGVLWSWQKGWLNRLWVIIKLLIK